MKNWVWIATANAGVIPQNDLCNYILIKLIANKLLEPKRIRHIRLQTITNSLEVAIYKEERSSSFTLQTHSPPECTGVNFISLCGRAARSAAASSACIIHETERESKREVKVRVRWGPACRRKTDTNVGLQAAGCSISISAKRRFVAMLVDDDDASASDEVTCDFCDRSRARASGRISLEKARVHCYPGFGRSNPFCAPQTQFYIIVLYYI